VYVEVSNGAVAAEVVDRHNPEVVLLGAASIVRPGTATAQSHATVP
jgi:hypothetical protein